VGCRLVVDEVVAVLVEVEAYLGLDQDPASHAHRGPTPRAAIMFGPAGHLYVYLSYGMHHCANLVTEAEGMGGAVLMRSAVVEVGEEVVRERRGTGRVIPRHELLRGPGNLCRGLGISLVDNGADVCSLASRVEVFAAEQHVDVVRGTRVGITRAADRMLRFAWRDHPAVSRPLVVEK